MISRLVALLYCLCAVQVYADFSGRVSARLDGQAIAGVEVFVESERSDLSAAVTRTDAQGRFSLALQPPFTVHLRHGQYQPARAVILRAQGSSQSRQFELLPNREVPLSDEEERLLADYRSSSGDALFLFPYNLLAAGIESSGFDSMLAFNLKRSINSELQSLNSPTVSVVLLPASLGAKPNRAVFYGDALNALALINGIGTPAAASKVFLQSEYQIVPARGGLIYVDDVFSSDEVRAGILSSKLHKLWAQTTFLSIASRNFQDAISGASVDTAVLIDIRSRLLDFRADLPGGDAQLLNRIDALLGKIRERLDS